MYRLEVYFAGDRYPRHVERTQSAPEAMARISRLIDEHDGCERIVVYLGAMRLFSVDSKGNAVPG